MSSSDRDRLPRVMLVGGIDSSGRAGLDADRAAARAFECDAVSIASAETDQDLFHVNRVEEQLLWHRDAADALASGDISALKVGLLPSASSIVEAARIVARMRHGRPERPAVVDPVISSSGGYRFWGPRELVAARDSLLVSGPILTPNLDELAELAWEERASVEDDERRVVAARRLFEAGVSAVVVKGGHAGPDRPLRDLVLEAPGADPVWIEREGVRGGGDPGVGVPLRHRPRLWARPRPGSGGGGHRRGPSRRRGDPDRRTRGGVKAAVARLWRFSRAPRLPPAAPSLSFCTPTRL